VRLSAAGEGGAIPTARSIISGWRFALFRPAKKIVQAPFSSWT
jgi:hypothetical protein